MKILIVLAHPEPESFNTAMYYTAIDSYLKMQTEEIYAAEMNNSYAQDTRREQEKVEWCDLMIWQFPLWRFAPPAILKGWSDRIFTSGRFFKNGGYYEEGTLRGKRALVSVTTGSGAETYTKGGFHGDIHGILRPINRGILGCVGFSVLAPEISYSVAHLTSNGRKMVIEKWRTRLADIFDEKEISVQILKHQRGHPLLPGAIHGPACFLTGSKLLTVRVGSGVLKST